MLIAAVLTWQLPNIYPSICKLLLPQVRMGLFIVAGALAVSLPSSTYTGVLVGLNRSGSSGIMAAGTRLVGGLAIVVLTRMGAPLSTLAAAFGGFYLLNAGLRMQAAHRHCPGLKVSPSLISKLRIKTLAAIAATSLPGMWACSSSPALILPWLADSASKTSDPIPSLRPWSSSWAESAVQFFRYARSHCHTARTR